MRKRGSVLAAAATALVIAATFACNAIIGLREPLVRGDGGSAPGDVMAETTPFLGDAFVAPPDTGPPLTGDAPQAGPPPVVVVINASRIPSVELCVGLGQRADGSDMQLPGTPQPPLDGGLATGLGGRGADLPGIATAYATVFVIPTPNVSPSTASCADLLGANGTGGVLSPKSYFRMPTIAPDTFSPGSRAVVAIVGCPPGFDGGVEQCGNAGPGGMGGGTLELAITPHLSPPDASGGLGVIALAASPALGCFGGACGTVAELSLTLADAAAPIIGPAPATGTLGVAPWDPMSEYVTTAVVEVVVDGGQTTWSFPTFQIASETLDYPMPATYFAVGETYVFVIIGDPSIPTDPMNTWVPGPSLRVLAFPWDIEAGTL
jgi:hypothetical protein